MSAEDHLKKAAEWIAKPLAAVKTVLLRLASKCGVYFRHWRRVLPAILALAILIPAAVLFFGRSSTVVKEVPLLPFRTRVLTEAIRFLEKARTNPATAFSEFASTAASEYFQELSENLWQTVHPELGWRWFFHGSLMTMTEDTRAAKSETNQPPLTSLNTPAAAETQTNIAAAEEALVAFYHPWSDTALITAWADTNGVNGFDGAVSADSAVSAVNADSAVKAENAAENGAARRGVPRILDCEIVMGDVFRTRGAQRPATTRAWARRQQYFAASIANTSAISLRALELLSFPSNTSVTRAPDRKTAWRNHIPFLLDADKIEANHIGAGILMLAAINDAARYAAPTNVFAIRVLPALQQLHAKPSANSGVSGVNGVNGANGVIKMTPEARQTLQSIPENYLEHYIPALYANSKTRAFIMLQAKQDPKRLLALLFGLVEPDENEKPAAAAKTEAPVLAGPFNEAANTANTANTAEEAPLTEDEDAAVNPVNSYALKLLRLDLLDIQAVYTNLYPK